MARRLLLLFAVGLGLLIVPAGALAASGGPVLVGSVSNTTSLAGTVSLAVAGNDAYATAYWPGQLTAVNISNPSNPTIDGSTAAATSLENGSNVTIAANYAFVVSKNRNASGTSNDDGSGNSMTIVDISNPASPSVVGTVHDTGKLFGSYGVAVSGHYAYVAYQGVLGGQPGAPDTSTGGFSVIDISNPSGPTIVANIDNGSLPAPYTGTNALQHATSVAISGNYAYVTAFYSSRVTVINIANPTSPAIVASLHDSTHLPWPVDLAVQGNDLYVAQQSSQPSQPQLTILDISNPAQPAVLGTLSNASLLNNAYRIRVRGSFAYLAAKNSAAIVAVDVSNPISPRIAGYVQDTSHLYQTTGLDLDSSGRYVVASSPELSTQSNGIYPPFTPTTGTISVIDLIPNPIGVTITPASEPSNPTSQTSASFSFSTSDAVSTVACSLDGAAYSACTSPTTQTYNSLSLGSHTFNVQATDAAGNTATASYTWTINPPAPTNTSAPTIPGASAPQQGQVLTAVDGSWSNNPTSYSHQWEDCNASGTGCTAIPSATGQSYTLTAGDVGDTIVVQEWASNSGGTGGPVSSAATGVVNGPPVNNTPPSISGTAAQGSTLNASTGSWGGYPTPTYSYQWEDCNASGGACSPIASATGQSYTLTAGDVGQTIVVQESASNASGTGGPVSSAATAVVSGPPVNKVAPGVSGTAAQGSTLNASTGSWAGYPAPTYSYQWEDCNASGGACSPIASATISSYTARATDVGYTLEVMVTGSNASGSSSASSGPTSVVTGGPTNASAPTIPGAAAPQPGQVLTAVDGSWSNSPASYSHQWEDCNASGSGCAAIPSATGQSYTVTAGDVGHTIVVQEWATNASGTGGPVSSAATGVVSTPPVNNAPPTVSGTPAEGSTVSASTGSWSGYPAPTYSYQWEDCDASGAGCVAISGATGQTYTLSAIDVGHTIRVLESARNSVGTGGPVASAQTSVVKSNSVSGPGKIDQRKIRAALNSVLSPHGKAARIQALLRTGSYKFWFAAPGAGRLSLSWYLVPKGASLTRAVKGHPKPTLVATAAISFPRPGRALVTLRLTQAGKRLLSHSQHVPVTAKASFTVPGQPATTVPLKRFTLRRH